MSGVMWSNGAAGQSYPGQVTPPIDLSDMLNPAFAIVAQRAKAAGWREAIEALRRVVDANLVRDYPDGAKITLELAAWLESLAPKETP